MKYIANYTKVFIILSLVALAIGCGNAANKTNTSTSGNAVRNTANTGAQIPTNAPIGATPPNMLGSPSAVVTVEEFADFQCPTCATIHTVMKNVHAAYGSRIKFIYRHYPLSQIHRNAYDASVAVEAAGAQGKFWDMQNLLFMNQKDWSNSTDARTIFEGYAQRIGLDVEKYKSDILQMGVKSRVDADIARGRALGISSTPTVYINGRSIPFEQMNIDSLKQIIDAELQKAGNPQTAPATANSAVNSATNSAANSASNSSANTAKTNANK